MPAISDNLIHFLGRGFKESPNQQLEIFKSIISRGLRCSKLTVNVGRGRWITNSVVCFSDIPLSECDEHAANYGKFGIGFKKSYVKRLGGNPARYFVNYIPKLDESRGLLNVNLDSQIEVMERLKALLKEDNMFALYNSKGEQIFSNERINTWLKQQLMILSYEKETGDLGPALDDTKQIDPYYKEREWRIVPYQRNIENGTVYLDEEDDSYYANFERKDVNVIVTPNDEMRTIALRYLLAFENDTDERMKKFAENIPPVITLKWYS